MNYGLPELKANETYFAAAGGDLQARLYEDFALALHAMAQPLTVLRGTIGLLRLRGATVPDAQRYLEMTHTQVERLCSLMAGMRNLLDNVQVDSTCASANLWELVESILDSEDSNLKDSGLRISVAGAGRDIHVLANPVLAEHAIQAALSAVLAVSQNGDAMYLTVNAHDGFADLTVKTSCTDGKNLNSVGRFHLSVAEVSIRSQHGLFECLTDPFRVSLKFPLYDHKEERSEPAGSSTSMQSVQ